jgi:hypothetical protein
MVNYPKTTKEIRSLKRNAHRGLTEKDKEELTDALYGRKQISMKQFYHIEQKIYNDKDKERLSNLMYGRSSGSMKEVHELLERNSRTKRRD